MTSIFLGAADFIRRFFPSLKERLTLADIKTDEREYISRALAGSMVFFTIILLALLALFYLIGIKEYILALIVSAAFSFLVFIQSMFKPTIVAARRIKDLERNLMPALEDILVQINSGIVLFEVLVSISKSNYGEVSKEFSKAVKEINAGMSEIEALDNIAARNPSLFFRRAIWQIINGMKGGAEISAVIEETNRLLAEEQAIEIQSYGSRLSPLAMFYMLIGVIMPALSITFIILLLSFAGLSEQAARGIFYGFYTFFLIFQIIFLGLISARRPNLI